MKNFKTLCQENYERIYRYVYAMTGDFALAEDLVQETFLIAYKKGEDFLKHEKPAAFLYRTAKLKTYEAIRFYEKNVPMELTDEPSEGDGDILSEILFEKDRQVDEAQYISHVIKELNAEQQDLYRQRYVENKTLKQIAKEKGIKETALKMRYVRLRKDVKRIVEEINMGATI